MAIALREATASQEIPLGYFLDATDGNTAETGLTIANTDIKLWKAGATTLADKNSGGATHIAGGVYYATMDATDTDTLGPMVTFIHVSGALAIKVELEVIPANVYDSLYGSDYLQVDTVQIEGLDATNQLAGGGGGMGDIKLDITEEPSAHTTDAELNTGVPINERLMRMHFLNTTANAVVIDVGKTSGASDIISSLSVGANAKIDEIVNSSSGVWAGGAAPLSLFISSPNWNGASLNVSVGKAALGGF